MEYSIYADEFPGIRNGYFYWQLIGLANQKRYQWCDPNLTYISVELIVTREKLNVDLHSDGARFPIVREDSLLAGGSYLW